MCSVARSRRCRLVIWTARTAPARASFSSQAVALQPDNDRATDGLRQVGQAELAQADAALQAGHLDQAAQQAASARDLLGGGSDVDRLDAQITQARAAQGSSAGQDGRSGRPGAAGAGGRQARGSRRVLARCTGRCCRPIPNNAVAAHGLDQVGDALAVRGAQGIRCQ